MATENVYFCENLENGMTITMKAIISTLIIVLLTLPLSLQAAETHVSLAWDASAPTPDGYQVFCREAGQNYDYTDPVYSGDHTFTQCLIENLDSTKTYYFVARAVNQDGQQSSNSNEATLTGSDSDSDRSVGGGGDSGITSSSCFLNTLLAD